MGSIPKRNQALEVAPSCRRCCLRRSLKEALRDRE
jgi:hypothetical protein